MNDRPRKHHFVPQFYLAGFTQTGSKEGELHVMDLVRQKCWKTTPRGAGHRNDFYRVDQPSDGDPMEIEKELSIFEGHWSNALRTIVDRSSLDDDEAFTEMMFFVAFLAVRVPAIRKSISSFIDNVMKDVTRSMISTESGKAQFRQAAERGGLKLSNDEFESMLEFAEGNDYSVDFDRTWHVQQMLWMAVNLAPALAKRRWRLWVADEHAPDLVCSDRPVALTYTVPPPEPIPPAFATPNTILTVPLNRRMTLASLIEYPPPDMRLSRRDVARINTNTLRGGTQAYFSGPDFIWIKNNRVTIARDDVLGSH